MQANDVCWHVQSAFEVAPCASLSFTSTLSTSECIISLQLQHLGTLLEMVLLGALQDTQAADSAAPLSDARMHGALAPHFELRQRHRGQQAQPLFCPDEVPADLLEGMYISCGVRDRLDVRSAVRHMFLTIVQHYRARMPHHVCIATCEEFVCMLQDLWGGKVPDPGCQHGPGAHAPGDPGLAQKQVPLQILSGIPARLVARSLWEEIQRPQPVVCTDTGQ